MNPKIFFGELKRRNVYKVAVAYAVVGWLLMQVASQIFPFFEIPNSDECGLLFFSCVIGFPIALIIAWAFEVTSEGIKRTEAADAAGLAVSGRHLDLCCPDRCGALGRFVLCWPLHCWTCDGTTASEELGVASRASGYSESGQVDRGAAIGQ